MSNRDLKIDLSRLEKYFTENISFIELSKELDELIFLIITLYGDNDKEMAVSCKELSCAIYRIKELRDLFLETFKDNQNDV